MTATQGLLMFTTVFAAVMGNFCKNTFCKGMLKNQSDNLCFNLVGNVFVLVVVTLLGGASAVAQTTFCYGAGMGIFNLLAALLFALALSCGPMSLTTLIQLGISLVVSALLGPVFWHEPITAANTVVNIRSPWVAVMFLSSEDPSGLVPARMIISDYTPRR